MKKMRSSISCLVCAAVLAPLLPVAGAQAAPLGKMTISKDDGVTLVHRRGRRGGGGAGAAALFGGIIAGAIIASSIREGRAEERDMRRCEEDFRSFDPRTGTYINRYGEERVCPYLR